MGCPDEHVDARNYEEREDRADGKTRRDHESDGEARGSAGTRKWSGGVASGRQGRGQDEPRRRRAHHDSSGDVGAGVRRSGGLQQGQELRAGELVEIPAGTPHFVWFRGEVEAQVEAIGPMSAIPLNPVTGEPW